MARHRRALQANGDRRRVERHSPAADDGRVHRSVRQAREAAFGQRALRDIGLCGDASLAVLLKRSDSQQREPCRQRKYDLEGLLPATGDPHQLGNRQLRRFSAVVRDPSGVDAVLSIRSELANAGVAASDSARVRHSDGRRLMVCVAQREIPRLPIHRSFSRAVRDLHLAGRLFQRHRSAAVAIALFIESHGRSHRRIPVGDHRRRHRALRAGVPTVDRACCFLASDGDLVFQKN